MADSAICRMSLVEMARAIRRKKLSPVQAVQASLDQIKRFNPEFNAFCTLCAESALRQASKAEADIMSDTKLGPLHGVPISIKDLINTRGIRTTYGSKIFENFVPEQNDTVVDRLEAAGAIVIGKTNTSEFGWVAITNNLIFGATRNPWSPDLTSGGSSGGAAVSTALCMVPLAIGSDGGGSIRIPSSFCGVFGFKPSFGRVPQGPGETAMETITHIGPITRTVADAVLAMKVMAGRDDRDFYCLPDDAFSYHQPRHDSLDGMKIAWSPDLGTVAVDPQVEAIARKAAIAFSSLGAIVEEPALKVDIPDRAFSNYIGAGSAAVLKDRFEEYKYQMDPGLALLIARDMNISAIEYIEARKRLLGIWKDLRPIFEKYDLLLTPAVAVPPFEIGSYGPREIAGRRVSPLRWMALDFPFNITGQPAASIPCGYTAESLPVGLQIVGRRFDDAAVLRAAAAYEKAFSFAGTDHA